MDKIILQKNQWLFSSTYKTLVKILSDIYKNQLGDDVVQVRVLNLKTKEVIIKELEVDFPHGFPYRYWVDVNDSDMNNYIIKKIFE